LPQNFTSHAGSEHFERVFSFGIEHVDAVEVIVLRGAYLRKLVLASLHSGGKNTATYTRNAGAALPDPSLPGVRGKAKRLRGTQFRISAVINPPHIDHVSIERLNDCEVQNHVWEAASTLGIALNDMFESLDKTDTAKFHETLMSCLAIDIY
jgi:hypothetical protein